MIPLVTIHLLSPSLSSPPRPPACRTWLPAAVLPPRLPCPPLGMVSAAADAHVDRRHPPWAISRRRPPDVIVNHGMATLSPLLGLGFVMDGSRLLSKDLIERLEGEGDFTLKSEVRTVGLSHQEATPTTNSHRCSIRATGIAGGGPDHKWWEGDLLKHHRHHRVLCTGRLTKVLPCVF